MDGSQSPSRRSQFVQSNAISPNTEADSAFPSLCEYCSRVPLKYDDLNKLDGEETWPLGTFGEVRIRTCPLCQLVESACVSGQGSWEPATKPEDSTPVLLRYNAPETAFDVDPLSPLGTYICFATADDATLISATKSIGEWIDPGLCKRWLAECQNRHGRDCAHIVPNVDILRTNEHEPSSFRLIDVKGMNIVNAPHGCQYLALSYVWGNPKDGRLVLNRSNRSNLSELHSLTKYWDSIPKTISSAIQLVSDLGEHYLWVDSLCLLQDNQEELRKCTELMDLIYGMATVTIVAASGANAYAGLPGVHPTPRKDTRLVNEVLPGTFMTTVLDVDATLRVSHYASRGWT